MFTKSINLELKLYELDILQEIVASRLFEWKKALSKAERGDESLNELIDCDSELDAEYDIENYEKLSGLIGLAQRRYDRNSVEFLDEEQVYRVEQRIELYKIRGCGIDKVVYVFKEKHGAELVYERMEDLLSAFSDGKESKLRFECSNEVAHFLSYWRTGENG